MKNEFTIGTTSALPDIRWQPNEFIDCNRVNPLFEQTLEEDLAYLNKLRRVEYHRRVKEEIRELENRNGIHRTYPDRSIEYWHNQFTC